MHRSATVDRSPRSVPPTWSGWRRVLAYTLRAVVLVQAALVFWQALLAGRFMTGDAVALTMHELNGTEIVTTIALLQLVLSVLVWRPARGPWWPAVTSVALMAALVAQIGSGFGGRLALHVPLGVAIFGLSVAALIATRPLTAAHPR